MWGGVPPHSIPQSPPKCFAALHRPLAPQRIKENHIQSEGVVEPHILITDGQIESDQKKNEPATWA